MNDLFEQCPTCHGARKAYTVVDGVLTQIDCPRCGGFGLLPTAGVMTILEYAEHIRQHPQQGYVHTEGKYQGLPIVRPLHTATRP